MKEFLKEIFIEHGYAEVDLFINGFHNELRFYKNSETDVNEYYLLYYVKGDPNVLEEEALKLEKYYKTPLEKTDQSSAIYELILDKLLDSEKRFLDKNTSVIFVIENEGNNPDDYDNIVFRLEESTRYYKRFVLLYSEAQIKGLKEKIFELIKTETENLEIKEKYYKSVLNILLKNNNQYDYLRNDSKSLLPYYPLVVMLFSKLTFLQYEFKQQTENIILSEKFNNEIELQILQLCNDAGYPEMKNLFSDLLMDSNKQKTKDIEKIIEIIELSDEQLESINREVEGACEVQNKQNSL